MQFKHPEIFYFLFVLLIPILVHLFQLQKFKKIAFTNVAFLKKISLETRKSSRLKKWLILSIRLLGLLALIFVFSQPYISTKKASDKNHNFIYLDNSLSLNTNGQNGNQLRLAAQEIIMNSSAADEYSLITNDEIYTNITKNELDELLKKIAFSSKKNSIQQKILEIESQKNKKSNTLYKNILISDFQYFNKNKNKKFTNVNSPYLLTKTSLGEKSNVSIDSVFINNNTAENILVSVTINNQGAAKKNIPIALYNDSQLVNKRSFSIEKDTIKKIVFSIPKTTTFKGKIQITFNDVFLFDNTFYFNVSRRKKIDILSIGKASKSLSKIYTSDEFNFTNSPIQNVNYNVIPNQHLIILNQVEEIPVVLQNSMFQFIKNGGHLLVIPDTKIKIQSYNAFFSKIATGSISSVRKDSLKITQIHYQHPIFAGVFSKQVTNFQYPTVSVRYLNSFKGSPIISYENKKAFLLEVNSPTSKIYWFSSPIDLKSTNFSNSPLIVPTLYNIGQQSLQLSKPYYTIQEENTIEVNKKIRKDEILTISNASESFIPLQQSSSSKVRLTTNDQPKTDGFYTISLARDTIETVAYNYSNQESLLSFYDLNELKKENSQFEIYASIEALFKGVNEKNEVQWLWKLFLAIAIVSLLLEIFILKFFKT
ncbi:MAG: BatA domain-containing protein [Flavobacteriaceae bacterium]|nr:BatA domain-containing protein [Flavobacteriaceae bacterium]